MRGSRSTGRFQVRGPEQREDGGGGGVVRRVLRLRRAGRVAKRGRARSTRVRPLRLAAGRLPARGHRVPAHQGPALRRPGHREYARSSPPLLGDETYAP